MRGWGETAKGATRAAGWHAAHAPIEGREGANSRCSGPSFPADFRPVRVSPPSGRAVRALCPETAAGEALVAAQSDG